MSADRYVVVGLAHVRSGWFVDVARWATSGQAPIEFVKCVSTEELRARVHSGRPYSAALLDGRLATVDRDLIASLRDLRIPSLVVPAAGSVTDWHQLGAAHVLSPDLARHELLDGLADHAQMISSVEHDRADENAASLPPTWLGRVVAVTGRPGSGRSTIAAALAQGLADDPRNGHDVVLADLAHHAHQALLHDARDVVPGIQELVEAHRSGRPSADQIRRLTYTVPNRGYRLVLGLRRSTDWVTIRSRAFTAAVEGLRTASRVLVTDIDADLEGESVTGSLDIEDRNLMARTMTGLADVVVVVANPSTTGIHGLVVHLDDLRSHGVPGERTLVVVNRAPRSGRARADLTRTIAQLSGASHRTDPYAGPVFVPERRNVDHLHRDLARFPTPMSSPVTTGATAVLERLGARVPVEAELQPVVPGSLGRWSTDDPDEEALP